MDKKVLIGTFVKNPHVSQKILKSIVENFSTEKIFIFSVDDSQHKRLVTFNIDERFMGDRFVEFKKQYKNTLRLHRRKDSNTFYTINSLNRLVEKQNNGNQNNNFRIDWKDFSNCCLVLDKDEELKNLQTKLVKVIEI
jgi:hypothetical protein